MAIIPWVKTQVLRLAAAVGIYHVDFEPEILLVAITGEDDLSAFGGPTRLPVIPGVLA
jgi:hypothetical protein